ncbi:MAG: hypothetical protein FWC80_00470 [Firmicutes bacterium]|nr:hypothetical protein [Bacillota bacterium]
MKNIVCVSCTRQQPMSIDVSSSVILLCIFCGARLKAKRDKSGRVKIEEIEAADGLPNIPLL